MAGVDVALRLPTIEALVVTLHGAPRALTPTEDMVTQRYAEHIRDYVQARWPVDTGTSVDAWEVVTSGTPGEYGITVYNDIDYVEWVHPAGMAPGGDYWLSLITEAWMTYRAPLLADLENAIRNTEAAIAIAGRSRAATMAQLRAAPIQVRRVAA